MTDTAGRNREAISAARRQLGGQLAAWRHAAGLTQGQLAHRAGYHRSAIAHAEAGDPASRALIAAVDQQVGAGGRLVAAHDTITAAVAAVRSEAARRARASAAALADAQTPPAPARPEPVVATGEGTCPACAQRLAVRVVVSLLPAVPATHSGQPDGGEI
jgi:transcriptional regulator with XRE-family HTH domain